MRPIPHKLNKDEWGFFQVGEFKTYSKLEAIEISGKTGADIHWNYNDHVFDSFDWTQEPPGSLDFWYGARAQQLRDTYDYIVLLYSGGADSHNMLTAFVKNNIFVDEIAQFFALDGSSNDKMSEVNKETFVTSAPNTQRLIETNPTYRHTIHRMIDGGKFETTILLKQNPWDYWYTQANTFFCPWGQIMARLREIEPAYRALADQGKKVCFLWAAEKLTLNLDQNKNLAIVFSESGMSSMVTPERQIKNDPSQNDEAFYWTPDMPELACKQAHVVKRYIANFSRTSVDNINVFTQDRANQVTDKKILSFPFISNNIKYHMTTRGLHSLIYPYWDHNTVVTPKPPSPFFGSKDVWLRDSSAPDTGYTTWFPKGVVWLRDTVRKNRPDLWWEQPATKNSVYSGGMAMFTKTYKV
jgi:hypothetical protein